MTCAGAGAHGVARPATSPRCILLSSTHFILFSLFFFPLFLSMGLCREPRVQPEGCRGRGVTGSGVPLGQSPMSFTHQLRCRLAAAHRLLSGAILSPDRWASAGVWGTAMGGTLGGGLWEGKSRWDFSGDFPILPLPTTTTRHPERFQ